MKIVAIVQARTRSSRLPAKVLLDLGGETCLQRCVARVRRIPSVQEVVVATSDGDVDDVIHLHARRLGCRTFRGSEHDVLSRYAGAARETDADVIVRITSDCPFLDPQVSEKVVQTLAASQGGPSPVDYASNVIQRHLPRGLDTEAFTRDALERANRDATDEGEREHVTLHLYRNVERFRLSDVRCLPAGEDRSNHRWTLDTLADYRFLVHLVEQLGPRTATASLAEICSLLDERPDLVAMNAGVPQKSL